MQRVLAVASLAVLGSCRCERLVGLATDVSVEPDMLDFGAVPLNEALSLPLTVSNRSGARVPLEVTVVGPPFSTEVAALDLGGGATESLRVRFSPVALGPVSGAVEVRLDDGTAHRVTVEGEGIAACGTALACHRSTWDPEARACRVDAEADGTRCAAACLTDAACRAGECVGGAPLCADSDECTVDVCTGAGCAHLPRACPTAGPCRGAYCDPKTGCALRDLFDGTPCGPSSCEEAQICLSGECRTARRPNADLECRYTAISANGWHTCALNRAGSARCWGANASGQLGRPLSPAASPGTLPVPGPVSAVATGGDLTCAVQSTGGVRCFGYGEDGGVPGPAQAVATGSYDTQSTVCGVNGGALSCTSLVPGRLQGPLPPPLGGVRAVALGPRDSCVAFEDGGAACWNVETGTPKDVSGLPGPVTQLDVTFGVACAVIADGVATACWSLRGPFALSASAFDGGVKEWVGRKGMAVQLCAVRQGSGEVECRAANETPPPLRGVDHLALGWTHGCALFDGGSIACWGQNDKGQLGDRTAHPQGPVEVDAGFAPALVATGGDATLLVAADGTTRLLGFHTVTRPLPPITAVWMGRDLRCHLGAQGAQCRWYEHNPAAEHAWDVALSDPRLLAIDPVAGWACVSQGPNVTCIDPNGVTRSFSPGSLSKLAVAQGVTGPWLNVFGLRPDGGVWADGQSNVYGQLGPRDGGALRAGPAVDLCSGVAFACALSGGQVECWGEMTPAIHSDEPTPLRGAWPFARQLGCGARHVCALVGEDVVQCWGDNDELQLGRDGFLGELPATFSVEERIRSLVVGEHSCVLLESGGVRCWGSNAFGQLGFYPMSGTTDPLPMTQ